MIKNQKMSKFINQKEDGLKSKTYKATDRDADCQEKGKPMGSIFCRSFNIRHPKGILAEAIMSISTYGECVVPDNNTIEKQNFQSNVEEFIFSTFERQVKVELCLLWLQEYEKNSITINNKDTAN